MTETTDPFVPPAADGLPLAALDSATVGADRLDASARTPYGRNFLAHALVQLARDGWLRTKAAAPVADRAAELETENARMRHELEVMYGGAFDTLKDATDRAALRDRIAEAVRYYPGCTPLTDGACYRIADAVLSVLPASADRAELAKQTGLRDYWHQEAMSATTRIIELEGQLEELRRERDLAIAHDRQPYPTAWAYEQACKALHRKEAAIERVLEFAASLDEIGRTIAGPDAVHPVAAHIRHLLDAQPADGPSRVADEAPQPEAPDLVAAIVSALQKRAGELSELAEEQMRPSLEERAQEWHEAADVARRAAKAAVGAQQPKEADGPRTVCVCGHTRGEHATVSGRLLCDECDPDSTNNLVCKEFEAL